MLRRDMLTATQLACAIVFAISTSALYGYVTGQAKLYTWRSLEDPRGPATPMAIPTAIAMALLAFAVFSLARVVRHELSKESPTP